MRADRRSPLVLLGQQRPDRRDLGSGSVARLEAGLGWWARNAFAMKPVSTLNRRCPANSRNAPMMRPISVTGYWSP